MPYTMEDFRREYAKEHFNLLTTQEQQECLESLPAKVRRPVNEEELQHLAPNLLVAAASRGDERGAPAPRRLERVEEDLLHALVPRARRLVRRCRRHP